MRVGARWFRFVHFEFAPTCPPPALRSGCSHQSDDYGRPATRRFDRFRFASKFFSWTCQQVRRCHGACHKPRCTGCEVFSHPVKNFHRVVQQAGPRRQLTLHSWATYQRPGVDSASDLPSLPFARPSPAIRIVPLQMGATCGTMTLWSSSSLWRL
jgi:hypothetical protein